MQRVCGDGSSDTYALDKILSLESVRFAGFVSRDGRLLVHRHRQGIKLVAQEGDVDRRAPATLQMAAAEGPADGDKAEYYVAAYGNIKRIMILAKKHNRTLVVSTERTSDHRKVVQEILPLLGS
jgi:roadblock/LC7 domain-containing protein